LNNINKKEDLLLIGKVVSLHGIRGNVKIHSYAESLAVFKPETRLFLKLPDKKRNGYTIKWAKPHSKGALLSLKEVDNRDQAERLLGTEIYIEKASLPVPEDGSYYWDDIIGLSVYTLEGEFLGKIDSILQTGSNDVYVVKNLNRGPRFEKLIPALKTVIQSIDLESKIMRIDLPEGL